MLFAAGEGIEIAVGAGEPEILTVTVESPGQVRFRLEVDTPGGWESVLRVDTVFAWDLQLRPFLVSPRALSGGDGLTGGDDPGGGVGTRWRLVAESAMTLRQLELLVREEYRRGSARSGDDADNLEA